MTVRIYRPARNATQSGKGNTDHWVLEYEQVVPRTTEPLMGWTSSHDTRQQLKLSFPTRAEAVAYAEREGLAYTVASEPPVRLHKKSYSDNFRWGRPENWTH
jgi:hypothetical protein